MLVQCEACLGYSHLRFYDCLVYEGEVRVRAILRIVCPDEMPEVGFGFCRVHC
jgi:hypothetical protein